MLRRLRNLTGTVQFKILGIFVLFLAVYVATFCLLGFHIFKSSREKLLSSYENMLELYTEQFQVSLENADSWMRTLAGGFDFNMMAIKLPETDDYTLSKYSLHYDIRTNRPNYSAADAIYLYDVRTDSFLMVPDDEDRFEAPVRSFWADGEENRDKDGWQILIAEETPVLFRQYGANGTVYQLIFVKLNTIAEELQTIAEDNMLSYRILTEDGQTLFESNDEQKKDSYTIESNIHMAGLKFCLEVKKVSLWNLDARYILLLGLSILVTFVTGWVLVLWSVRQRVLTPLEKLVDGMQAFAGNSSAVRLEPEKKIEPEMAFAMDTFNNMVEQIYYNRILVYEGELERRKLKIQLLNSQIDPHFFSNTLNMIYNLIAAGKGDPAKKSLILLSSYYRFMCGLDRELITLQSELDFVRDYLEIMKLRFPNKLDTKLFLDAQLKELLIPPMLLQPLAENSIKHGFTDRRQKFSFTLSAYPKGQDAVFAVIDSGSGFPENYRGIWDKKQIFPMPENEKEENHVGLANIYSRLMLHYGEDAALKIDWNGEGSEVRIVLHHWEKYLRI